MAVSVETPEFLVSCLKNALVEGDSELISDIVEAAELQNVTALTILRLDQKTVAERLFLTEEEAVEVLRTCRRRVAACNARVSVSLVVDACDTVRVRLCVVQEHAVEEDDDPNSMQPTEAEVVLDHLPEPEQVQQQQQLTVVIEEPHAEDYEDTFPPDLPPLVESEPPLIPAYINNPTPAVTETVTPAAAEQPIAVDKRTHSTPTSKVSTVPKTPTSAGKPKAVTPTTPTSTRRPSSTLHSPARLSESTPAPLKALGSGSKSMRKSVTIQVSHDGASSPLSPGNGSPSVPSYLRPTASHALRTSRQGPLETLQEDKQADMKGSPEKKKKKGGNVFARLGSTLLAPTAAFVARVTGHKDPAKQESLALTTKSTAMLDVVLSAPQGQRVTRAAPFRLSTELRPKVVHVVGQEEMDQLEMQKQFKRNTVPKHMHEARPLEFRASSKPKDPQELFKPFQLASLDRHTAMKDRLRTRQAERAAKEEEARVFKARQLSARMLASPQTPPKPEPQAVTRGAAPVFASEARITHYHAVVEPVKRAKEAEANKEKLEEEARQRALEEMKVEDFRKTLEFKAMRMPDFSTPFRPDPAKSKAVTPASEPTFHTDRRLGKPTTITTREDKDGPGVGGSAPRFFYDGSGMADGFAASLRSSCSAANSGVRRSLNASMGFVSGSGTTRRVGNGSGANGLASSQMLTYGSLRRSAVFSTGSMGMGMGGSGSGSGSATTTPAGKAVSPMADAGSRSLRESLRVGSSGSTSAHGLMGESVNSLLQAAIRAAAADAAASLAASTPQSCVVAEGRSRRTTSDSITVMASAPMVAGF